MVSGIVTLLATRVMWEAPPDNNDPITGYTLTLCDTTEGTCTDNTSQEPQTLFFVVPTHYYTLTITAINGAGSSQPTEVVGIIAAQPGKLCNAVAACCTICSYSFTGDANVTLTTSLLIDEYVILEWKLPPLATSLPIDQLHSLDSYFNVTGFTVFWGEGEPVSVDGGQTSYLYYVNDPGNVFFQVTVIYSNSFINNNLV